MEKELLDFKKFSERMIRQLNDIKNQESKTIKIDIQEEIKKSSKKHHFIPRYYINGFADSENELFIYDKQKDIIRNKKSGSSGIFFEENRNSIDLGDNVYISLFEEVYCFFDNNLKHLIKLLRSGVEKIDEKTSNEIIAYMNIFVLDLYLRNKNNDNLFDEIFHESEINFVNESLNEHRKEIKEMPGFKQLFRTKLFTSYIEEFFKMDPNKITKIQLINFEMDQICIGDMPLIFFNNHGQPYDLFNSPLILPISKSKLYLRDVSRKKSFYYEDTSIFNALIIDRSSKLIGCSNKKTLQDAIKTYKFLKEQKLEKMMELNLFFDFN
ncbi:DUF4238 domain-containing protein [Sphingobacterium sp. FBM7-1]|uniref:DUF4238 domain-containing protein n=1 Tax=Sphingobacterium sp. FBM7-1 TaxID=2886688 RepID=UPI001D12FE2D|nr:DUF4238 domain-containing protein [Sphingobacterium sp. FBM7-1]MCC2599786.1 DUF4238 domain-containing protein [Sphingobacterium sp. FBM7-1]